MPEEAKVCMVCRHAKGLSEFSKLGYVCFSWWKDGAQEKGGWICDEDLNVVTWMLRLPKVVP